MAWSHQFIDPTGRIKPCCRFAEAQRPASHSLTHTPLADVFDGPWMEDIRRKMLRGEKVSGCVRCYEEQQAGKKSLRERYNERPRFRQMVDLSQPQVKWLELALSNDCNLACRMCDSRYSWKWFAEEKQMFGRTQNSQERSQIDINAFEPFLDGLEHIKFTGGEPLITRGHFELLTRLVKRGRSQHIYLNYSTNCTVRPKAELVELWKNFAYVEFALSFDAASPGEAEYIRWPAKYSTILETTRYFLNLHKTLDARINLRSTMSLLNIFVLPETLDWWLKACTELYRCSDPELLAINPTHLTYPAILSVQTLPESCKQRVEEKLLRAREMAQVSKLQDIYTYMINYMRAADQSHLLPQLRTYLEKTDRYRKQDFDQTYPYFAEIWRGFQVSAPQSLCVDL